MRLIGAFITFGFLVLFVAFSSEATTYVDVPSLVLITCTVVGGLLMSFPPRDVVTAVRVAMGMSADRASLAAALGIFSRARELTSCAGVLGMLLGVIEMLSTMWDPAHFPPALALVLLCPLYAGVIGHLLFGAAVAGLRARQANYSPTAEVDVAVAAIRESQAAADGQGTLAG